ncbi:uncharacterized protein MONBRDRAFT_23281 [Monosiga brevicollis MX1]|uniref:Uncharacterized protein n=1 Tax=Monosiga brevicollis TaxID=81824 RepID=A9USY1_MONBE|nr:uncharacterized protein MONBRDRAFT_23281 [Monosiga brevicollis MX1]EDQ91147.1 predicted protein [Monosiga brevicollis MX1]|eukprot:XP_001743569.1 hypothetical protein [Monosiga brevicollis MX1]
MAASCRTVAALLCLATAALAKIEMSELGGRMDVKLYVDGNKAIWIDMNASAFGALQPGAPTDEWDETWAVPENNDVPYNHVFAAYNPAGHPGYDGFGHGYGTPHMDIHFFSISEEDRNSLAQCSSFPPCPVDNVSAAIFDYPSSRVLSDDFILDSTFGGHAVPRHGMHWLPKSDYDVFTPRDIDDSWPATPPRWLSCLTQASGGSDEGCRLGLWYPGISPILITLDGKTVAHEIMVSVDFFKRLRDGQISNPYIQTFPQVAEGLTDMNPPMYPTNMWAVYDEATDRLRFGMDLQRYKLFDCPCDCASCDEEMQCTSCVLDTHGVKDGKCQRCPHKIDGYCMPNSYCMSAEGALNGFCKTDSTFEACEMDAFFKPVACPLDLGCGVMPECTECRFYRGDAQCSACDGSWIVNENATACVADVGS